MTTIAYRDGIMATDTRVILNGGIEGRQMKAIKRGRVLAAACGTAAMCREFRAWISAGLPGDPPPAMHPMKPEWNYWGVVATPDHLLVLTEPGWMRIDAPYYATGSGGEYALGAMACGASAEQAVWAAIQHDSNSGGEITVVSH